MLRRDWPERMQRRLELGLASRRLQADLVLVVEREGFDRQGPPVRRLRDQTLTGRPPPAWIFDSSSDAFDAGSRTAFPFSFGSTIR
jgi:hypothetical protein